jgi:hypothetical protein
MKMKYITAAFAFAVTFGFSVLVIGIPQENYAIRFFAIRADNETGRQISFLLQRDDDNGREMDANFKFAPSPARFAEAVNQYVNDSEKIDDANLPLDFRNVWLEHLKAWRAQADFLKQSNLSDEKITEAEFLQTYRYQNAEIRRTWFDVLDVARDYGAVIPRNAY